MKRLAVLLPFLLGTSGCGGSGPYSGRRYATAGQVLLADGKPLAGGSIRFIPTSGGLPATGKIGPDGKFSLMTKTHEGAAPGDYKIRIEPSLEMVSKKGGRGGGLPYAAKYRNYEGDTGLTATVEARDTQLEPFRLESK